MKVKIHRDLIEEIEVEDNFFQGAKQSDDGYLNEYFSKYAITDKGVAELEKRYPRIWLVEDEQGKTIGEW